MTFELTESLKTALLNALENQEQTFLVDAEENGLIEETAEVQSDEERFYKLPEWTSAHGFALREAFVENLKSPLARESLAEVLHSGRGVFRNFRNVIREYPEVDKLWHKFKSQKMLEFINQWYNSLCEFWGLEKLDTIPESDENLIRDDFSFSEYSSVFDKEIEQNLNALLNGSNGSLPQVVENALRDYWKVQYQTEKQNQSGYVCHSLADEFAGCILVKPVSEAQKNVIFVTNFFVSERFRGLGIGSELLFMCVSRLKSDEEKWLILPNIIIPQFIKPLLLRTGFEEIDLGFLLKI